MMKMEEKRMDRMAASFNAGALSPSLRIVMNVDAPVQRNPIEAPMALMSTNQPSASRPRTGPEREMRMQNSKAFLGVPNRSSILAK